MDPRLEVKRLFKVTPNKAFKTDSQRLAFSAYFGVSVYVTMV
ncbi:hypothetical protein VSF3289_03751 [Vibrio scophthalmi]|uniref:Uncharacterized protein n=1 Tax=Vibrio scophthalmi TaxID=45658 RepID=A0A1E3WGI2_9VIBR|nr:hypothetical protein VSF3289_03751 [Vibrio scophthalmi]